MMNGQLPSFGQMRPMGQQMGGQQQMQPLGQMWQQPQQQPPTGQLPPMGQQQQQGQQVGMVPGVPGSMGLNPGTGGPMRGQQQGGFQSPFAQQGGFPGIGMPQHTQNLMQQFPQSFMQGHPFFQQMMSRMQGGQMPQSSGGQIMRPMGA